MKLLRWLWSCGWWVERTRLELLRAVIGERGR